MCEPHLFFFRWSVCVYWWESIPKGWDPKRTVKNCLFLVEKVGEEVRFFYSPSSAQKRDKLVTSFFGRPWNKIRFGGKFFQGKMELGSLMFSRTAKICDKTVRIKKHHLAGPSWLTSRVKKIAPKNSLCQVTHQNITS